MQTPRTVKESVASTSPAVSQSKARRPCDTNYLGADVIGRVCRSSLVTEVDEIMRGAVSEKCLTILYRC